MTTLGAKETIFIKTEEIKKIIRCYYTNDKLEPIDENKIDAVLVQMNAIAEYAKQEFPAVELLTPEQICVLTLSIRSPHPSPEQAIIAKDSNYMEVKRSLSRFYCLHLLLKGEEGYEAFIACQEKKNRFLPVLSKENYLDLSLQFQCLDPLSLDCLKTSTLIGAVPLSGESRKQADNLLGKNNYVVDSVEFPATIFEEIEKAKIIYPIVNSLFEKYPDISTQREIEQHLKNHFPHRMHYRHQIYTEGDQNMFRAFVQKVQTGELTKEDYEDWRNYWTVNILGFRGNVEPKGSVYLTENTYRTMKVLEAILEQVFDNKELTPVDILNTYLDKRAALLGLTKDKKSRAPLTPMKQRILAHIGAMLRSFSRREGDALYQGLQYCDDNVERLASLYFENQDETEPTPTYAPAFFANAISFRLKQYDQDSILQNVKHYPKKIVKLADELKMLLACIDAVVSCLPIYLAALREYRHLRVEGKMNPLQPLSFQKIAGADEITALLGPNPVKAKMNILEFFTVEVDGSGSVMYKPTLKKLEALQAEIKLGQQESQVQLHSAIPSMTKAYQATSSKPMIPSVTNAPDLQAEDDKDKKGKKLMGQNV